VTGLESQPSHGLDDLKAINPISTVWSAGKQEDEPEKPRWHLSIISTTSDNSPDATKAQNFELEYLGSGQFALGSKNSYPLLENSISNWLERNSELTEQAYKVCLQKMIEISNEENFVTELEANKLEEVEILEKNIIEGNVQSSALKKPENQKYRTIGRQSL
jgi:hypothetical protein